MAPNAGRCGCQNYLFVVKKSTRRENLSFLRVRRHFLTLKSRKSTDFTKKISKMKISVNFARVRRVLTNRAPICADRHKVARKKCHGLI